MEIKDGFVIADFMPEDTLLVAPQEFTALLVAYFEAIKNHDVQAYETTSLLIEKWISDKDKVKRLCIIKNIGK